MELEEKVNCGDENQPVVGWLGGQWTPDHQSLNPRIDTLVSH
jgi:hypothetical protein